MFDNLRDSAESSFYDEEPSNFYEEPAPAAAVRVSAARRRTRSGKKFLGMTAQQRLLLSLMVMLTVCLVGTMAMVVLGKMSLF